MSTVTFAADNDNHPPKTVITESPPSQARKFFGDMNDSFYEIDASRDDDSYDDDEEEEEEQSSQPSESEGSTGDPTEILESNEEAPQSMLYCEVCVIS